MRPGLQGLRADGSRVPAETSRMVSAARGWPLVGETGSVVGHVLLEQPATNSRPPVTIGSQPAPVLRMSQRWHRTMALW